MIKIKKERTSWRLFLKRKFYALHRRYLSMTKPGAATILFYPQLPGWKTGMHRILMEAGIGATDKPEDPFSIAVFWEDKTFRNRKSLLEPLQATKKVINYECTDISKEKVEHVFEKVFGYHLRVSPESGGKILKKSNYKGTHDGEIIQGPLQHSEEGVVYERLLNNEQDNGLYEDLRLSYFKGAAPVVSLRYHPREARFSKVCKATLAKLEEQLSQDELARISDFCEQLGLEYGELDLIRDKHNKFLYIVDVNPTPRMPPSGSMNRSAKKKMVRQWSASFTKAFLDNKVSSF